MMRGKPGRCRPNWVQIPGRIARFRCNAAGNHQGWDWL